MLGYVKEDQSFVNSFDCHGRTPLHLAVKWRNGGAAKLMVRGEMILVVIFAIYAIVQLRKLPRSLRVSFRDLISFPEFI